VKLSGTILNPDGSYGYVDVEGGSYEEARDNLCARLEEGQKLITIRSDR
jgi:hypothetical protein